MVGDLHSGQVRISVTSSPVCTFAVLIDMRQAHLLQPRYATRCDISCSEALILLNIRPSNGNTRERV